MLPLASYAYALAVPLAGVTFVTACSLEDWYAYEPVPLLLAMFPSES
jgi:hypothetical protein